MSEGPSIDGENLPQAELREPHQRRISTVWIIPIVAALIGGGLAWRTLSQRGPEMSRFSSVWRCLWKRPSG